MIVREEKYGLLLEYNIINKNTLNFMINKDFLNFFAIIFFY